MERAVGVGESGIVVVSALVVTVDAVLMSSFSVVVVVSAVVVLAVVVSAVVVSAVVVVVSAMVVSAVVVSVIVVTNSVPSSVGIISDILSLAKYHYYLPL